MSSEVQQRRLLRMLGFEAEKTDDGDVSDMDVENVQKEIRKFVQKQSRTYAVVGVRKHRDLNKRIGELCGINCCATGKCLANFAVNHRAALEYQITRWDSMNQKQKSGAVFDHWNKMRTSNRTRITQTLLSGYKTSKTGRVSKVYPSEVETILKSEVQHALWDPFNKCEVRVCQEALRKITNSFSGTLNTQVNDLLNKGAEQYYTQYAFARRSRACTKSATVISWVEHQINVTADINPANDKKMWLPYDDWTAAYQHYSHMVKTGVFGEWGVENPAGISLFRKIVKVHFKEHIRFAKKYNTFTKCNTCSDYKIQIRRAGAGSAPGRVWLKHYFRHLMWQAQNRLRYHNHATKGKCFPHKYCSIIMDGSDNHSFEIPFFGDKRKDWGGVERPKTRSTGVLMHSDSSAVHTGGMRLYITDERTKKGTNFNVTVLLHALLKEREARGGVLPPYLYLQMDSAGDNKSKTMARVCEYLVKMGVFLKIKVCMLPVGHTHEDIDAGFGRLNRKFVQTGTVTSTTAEGLARAREATQATRDLVWVKVCLIFSCLF